MIELTEQQLTKSTDIERIRMARDLLEAAFDNSDVNKEAHKIYDFLDELYVEQFQLDVEVAEKAGEAEEKAEQEEISMLRWRQV